MRLERRPEKNLPQRTPVGKKCAGNLGRNQGSSSKRFEAHPTKPQFTKMKLEQPILPDWMHGT